MIQLPWEHSKSTLVRVDLVEASQLLASKFRINGNRFEISIASYKTSCTWKGIRYEEAIQFL